MWLLSKIDRLRNSQVSCRRVYRSIDKTCGLSGWFICFGLTQAHVRPCSVGIPNGVVNWRIYARRCNTYLLSSRHHNISCWGHTYLLFNNELVLFFSQIRCRCRCVTVASSTSIEMSATSRAGRDGAVCKRNCSFSLSSRSALRFCSSANLSDKSSFCLNSASALSRSCLSFLSSRCNALTLSLSASSAERTLSLSLSLSQSALQL